MNPVSTFVQPQRLGIISPSFMHSELRRSEGLERAPISDPTAGTQVRICLQSRARTRVLDIKSAR